MARHMPLCVRVTIDTPEVVLRQNAFYISTGCLALEFLSRSHLSSHRWSGNFKKIEPPCGVPEDGSFVPRTPAGCIYYKPGNLKKKCPLTGSNR